MPHPALLWLPNSYSSGKAQLRGLGSFP
jgi:hypothetical protein